MKYICQVCGYVYDEEKEGPFSELKDDFKCPLCGAPKSEFKKEEKPINGDFSIEEEEELTKLNFGQLAAVCSNLARGCEKQYKEKEASLFRELSDYFTKRTSYKEDATVEKVSSLLQDDILNYSHLSKVCNYKKDRGAQRVCVWGEKVTRMLSSLVTRYLQEGEEMLKDESIWLCTICGFIYIGKNPPELCPVCKVPSYKFEKVEGGR